MAYNNQNYLQKCQHILRVTEQHYESGRQDRCYRWVWEHHIHDQFHVNYAAYLICLRRARAEQCKSQARQMSLFD